MREIVKTGLEMFDVSSSRELQDYLTYFTHEMCSAGTHYFILLSLCRALWRILRAKMEILVG